MITFALTQIGRYFLIVGILFALAVILFLLSGLSHQKEGQVRVRYRKGMPASIIGKGWHYAFPFSAKESKKMSLTPHPYYRGRFLIEIADPILFDSKRKSLQNALKNEKGKEFAFYQDLFAACGAKLIEITQR